MTQHSKAPWKACRYGECRCGFIWSADGQTHVASVHGPDALGEDWYGSDIACNEETKQANARLIAAAPELLEALKVTVRMLEAAHRELGMYTAHDKRINAARAAIAKAEGREA